MTTKDEVAKWMVNFYLAHLKVLFLITMGAGKTKGSLDAVVAKYGYTGKGLIVCFSVNSRDKTWPAEIKRFHPRMEQQIRIGMVELVHKDHARKRHPQKYDWIIWDECHAMKVDDLVWLRYQTFVTAIFMTGTETQDSFMKTNLRNLVKQNVMEFPTEQAIDEGLINDYRVKAIHISLTKEEYDGYLPICAKLGMAMDGGNQNWIKIVQGERARYLYNIPGKLQVVKQLNQLLSDKRRILFMATKEACAEVSPYIYHSGTKDTDLLRFARGDIDELASCRMLRTGANIKNFDTILCQQVNSKYVDFMQMLGRLFRLEIGQIGWIYAVYITETQDMVWLDKATIKIPREKQRHYDLSKVSLQEVINDRF